MRANECFEIEAIHGKGRTAQGMKRPSLCETVFAAALFGCFGFWPNQCNGIDQLPSLQGSNGTF